MEGRKKIRSYGDVVVCRRRVDGDDGHGITMVSQRAKARCRLSVLSKGGVAISFN